MARIWRTLRPAGLRRVWGRLRTRPIDRRSPTLSAKKPGRSATPANPPTRRERREALRREQAGRPSRSRRAGGSPGWRSPTVLITVTALAVALAVIAALNLRPGGSGAGPGSGSSPGSGGDPSAIALNAPANSIPASIPRDGQTLGSPSAKVVLDLWEDFQCPSCGNFTRSIEPVLIQRYVLPGTLRLTFHDYAFLGAESQKAASAARCAGLQGRFWDYQAWVYANQNGENQGWLTRDRLAAIAARVGLDGPAWAACFDGDGQAAAVTAELAAGQAAGVESTPSLFLDGKLVPLTTFSSWDDLYAAIDVAIAASGGSSGSPATPGAAASPGATASPVSAAP